MTIPNLITIFRFMLVPVVIVAILQEYWLVAFVLFVLAGVSDGVDGYVARRFDMRSELGAFIDPLADKALLVSIFVTLAIVGVLPVLFAVVVVARDVLIVMGVLVSWLLRRPMKIAPLMISKANTCVQIAFAALVLGALAFSFDLGAMTGPLVLLVTALTIVTAAAYLVVWLRHMTQ
ncbi:MAG: CDP-alcohol phosphatidyltransferase family protein [Salinarimonadaceae bacterium]|nr:MAG: CDP-alcohol phosphatidyltransferase family protein [Salinarimonadaceae bacterium]